MSEYTPDTERARVAAARALTQLPTTGEVRHKFSTVLDDEQGWRQSQEWGEGFDRWLAAERARVTAETAERIAEAIEHRAKQGFISPVRDGMHDTARIAREHGGEQT